MSDDKIPYARTFTRITDYKKDTAKYTNGNVILTKDTASIDKPVMMTLADCEQELGAAILGDPPCVKLYGHTTTKAAKQIKIVPSDKPCILWCPTRAEPAAGGASFTADNMGQWLRSREALASGSSQGRPMFECK